MAIYKSFETERLLLRPVLKKDAEFILALLNMPKWRRYIGDRNVHSIKEAEEYITTRMLPQLKRLGYGNYTVIRKSDQAKLGTCGLYDREGMDGFDIGFAFLPQYENRGYAFEAAEKIKNVAFTEWGIQFINGITSKENISSQNLLKKLGMMFIETTMLDKEEVMLYRIHSQ